MQEIVVSGTLRDRLEALAGRRRDVWVAAGVVVALVVAGLAWWSRSAPATIAPPAVSPATPSASEAAGLIFVHVAGAVRNPGLYELPSGARVADALESAGGPRRKGDLDALNLAQVLVDGMKITVSRIGQAVPDAGAGEEPGVDAVSLNSADQAALEEVPGIGPVTATAILAHRTRIGTFESLDQLLDVTGIGPATLESIRPYLTL